MNVYLIGYRGTGKTTIARLVAERLGAAAIDADEFLERRAKRSIREIFATDGEPTFRELEVQTVSELARLDRHVVSLGGGAVMRQENRDAIAAGKTVWLDASPETLWARLQADPSTADRRPNLTAQGGIAEIREKMAERRNVYESCAQLRVDTERQRPAEAAATIVDWLAREGLSWTSG